MLDFWILSMNERNLNYIKKLNSASSINLADDKVETKLFLEERWVSVPKTLAIVSNKKQLAEFELSSIKEDFFVIKPVFGSKWQGILIVENLHDGTYMIWDEIVSEDFLYDHMTDILNWDFSLNFGFDKILIEKKLIAGNGFEKFCQFWLADIRIIVYNLVPVAAMVRMPTALSGWKANLAQGGIGLGIEVGSGIINTIYIKWKVYTKDFPLAYAHLKWFEIPFWNDIMLASSQTQFFVNLWYLALDWVITETWPKILEINARAGLEIQNVCLLPLKSRLDKIKDLKIREPEKWVELAKSLFSLKVTNKVNYNKIIYLSQEAKLNLADSSEDIVVKIDLTKTKNYISSYLQSIISKNEYFMELDFRIKFDKLKFIIDDNLDSDTIVLWTNAVKDFFIKPEVKTIKKEIYIPKKVNKNELSILRVLDEKVMKLDKRVSLTATLKPSNFLEQMNKFIEMKGNYNPIFTYDFPDEEKINSFDREILSLKETYFKKWLELKSEFAKIFQAKLEEIQDRLELIKAYKLQNFDNILKYNTKLFWKFDEKLLIESETKLLILSNEWLLGESLDINDVVEYIKNYLEKNWLLNGVKVVLSATNMSRISVTRKKWKAEIRVAVDAIFKEKELDWIIAHEIGVHLIRAVNGKKSGWNILESWTANYIETEEWLAVYNSLEYFPDSYEKNAMFQNYYIWNMAKKLDFQELAAIVFHLKWNDYVKVFKTVTRFKKWIIDTSTKHAWAIFTKDKIYLDWYIKVKNWIENGWDASSLMIWKIKISDLDVV